MARFCSHSQSTIAAVEANSISLRASISLFHMHKMIHFKPTSLRRYKRNSRTIPFYKNGALVVWAVKIFHSHSGMFASLQVIVDLLGCDDVLFKPHRLEVVKGMLRQEICLIFAYHEPLKFLLLTSAQHILKIECSQAAPSLLIFRLWRHSSCGATMTTWTCAFQTVCKPRRKFLCEGWRVSHFLVLDAV